ncbi:MAG: class I SAM-dependent methyltransferase [Acidobacteriaceae bacterium]|jgi:SAM-dependent methyltransferase
MKARAAQPDFDRVARIYRWMEYATFGRSLERCRKHFLPHLSGCRSSLVLGDGDGRFLTRLLAGNRDLTADAVDTSRAMLRLLERRAGVATQDAGACLRTHHTDALAFLPQHTYDLIATHFFFDCLTQTEVDALVTRIASHAKPRGLWVVSEFRVPSGAMRWPSHIIVRTLYLAFRFLTGLRTRKLPDHATAMSAAGFTRTTRRLFLGGLLTSELWQFQEYTPAMLPPQHPRAQEVPDPLPDPEPPSPSLPGPDPDVYHREPATSPPPRPAMCEP